MSFTTLKKKYCLTALILVLFVSAIFLFLGANSKSVKATSYNTGASVDIGFSYDFTDYSYNAGSYLGNSTSWYNYVYESENMRLSPAINSLSAGVDDLGMGQGDKSTGYIVYKISAGGTDGVNTKVFNKLNVIASGRVFHYMHSDCSECKMVVSLGFETDNYEEFETVKANDQGAPSTRYFDLTEKVKGKAYCFVKLAFTGYAGDWVNLLNVTVDGEYYYEGLDPVELTISDVDKNLLVTLGSEVPVKEITASGIESYTVDVEILDASGNPVVLTDSKFVANTLGRYTVKYTVNDQGRIYYTSYFIYCVEDATKGGLSTGKFGNYANTEVIKEDNYTVFDNGELSSTGSAVEIEGPVGYKIPLDLSGNVSVSFTIDRISKGSSYEFAFTQAVDTPVGDYTAKGLYYKFIAEEVTEIDGEDEIVSTKYYLYGYYQDGTSLIDLGRVEYSTFKGSNYIYLSPLDNAVSVIINGVNLNSVCDYTAVKLDGFTLGNKTYLSCNSSRKATFKLNNIINFINFNGYDKTEILNEKNYYVSSGSSLIINDDSVGIDGTLAYLLPINFSSRFAIVFDVKSLPQGAYIDLALTQKPGIVNFDTKTENGLYYNLKVEGTNLLFSGYYQSGKEVISLGQHGQSTITGVHGLGINRRVDQGISSYFDGVDVFSSNNYYHVNPLDFTSDVNVYLSVRVVKSEFEINNMVLSDERTPVLTNPYDMTPFTLRNFPSEGIVGDTFVLPEAIMYDAIDGELSYSVSVLDTNGNGVETFLNSDGRTCFDVIYEGIYSITYSAVDFSGNSVVSEKFITMEIKSGAPKMYFSDLIDTFGRQGRAIKLPKPTVRVNGKSQSELVNQVRVTVIHPSGATIIKEANTSFTPFDLGVYEIIYEVSNAVETTYAYFSVNVKADVDPEDSYNDFKDSNTWVKYSNNVMEETEDGIMIYGENKGMNEVSETAYCKLPFEMTQGVEITLDLTGLANKSDIDNWFSLGIGSSPKHGNFAMLQTGYLYFMLYYENGTYYVNAQYMSATGGTNGLFGPIDMGTSGIVTISLEKLTGSSLLTDNVNIYLNHRKTAYGTENLVRYSHLVDDENFSYLSVYNYGVASSKTAKDFKSVIIKEVTVCDQVAPQFSYDGELPTKANLGDTVIIPTITVTDNNDPGFVYSVMLVDPLGNEINLSKNGFIADQKGVYYLVFRGYDKSGNYEVTVNEIAVGLDGGGNVALYIVFTILLVGACVVEILLVIKIVKKKKR